MHAAPMGRVSPSLHQRGNTKYSPPTSATMGGEYSPAAAPPMPLARASPFNRSTKGSMAPPPAQLAASTPSTFPSTRTMGREYGPTAILPMPLARAHPIVQRQFLQCHWHQRHCRIAQRLHSLLSMPKYPRNWTRLRPLWHGVWAIWPRR